MISEASSDAAGAMLRWYVHVPGVEEPIVAYDGAGLTDRRRAFAGGPSANQCVKPVLSTEVTVRPQAPV